MAVEQGATGNNAGKRPWWRQLVLMMITLVVGVSPPLSAYLYQVKQADVERVREETKAKTEKERQQHAQTIEYIHLAIDETTSLDTRRRVFRYLERLDDQKLREWAKAELDAFNKEVAELQRAAADAKARAEQSELQLKQAQADVSGLKNLTQRQTSVLAQREADLSAAQADARKAAKEAAGPSSSSSGYTCSVRADEFLGRKYLEDDLPPGDRPQAAASCAKLASGVCPQGVRCAWTVQSQSSGTFQKGTVETPRD